MQLCSRLGSPYARIVAIVILEKGPQDRAALRVDRENREGQSAASDSGSGKGHSRNRQRG